MIFRLYACKFLRLPHDRADRNGVSLCLLVSLKFLLFLSPSFFCSGQSRIPEIARALGRASHEFKKAKDEIINETEELKDAAEKKAALEDQAGKKDNDKKNDSE